MKGDTEIIPVFSVNDDELSFEDTYQSNMPILALKNTVLFPGVVIPITVGRDKSILALNKADKSDKFIGVLTQKDMDSEDPDTNELYTIGTIAKILRVLKMPDGSTTAILQGRKRFSVDYFISNDKMIEAAVSPMEESLPLDNIEFNAMVSTIRDYSKKIIKLSSNIQN